MNVGIYCSQITEKAGGGYVFQQEILRAVFKLAEKSHHLFTLFVPSLEGFQEYAQSERIQLIVLPKMSPSTLSTKKKWKKWSAGLLDFLPPEPPQMMKKLPNRIASSLAHIESEHKVDLFWFVGPPFEEIPDMPYLATVWDLQHRLQPFFPEVSSNGIWEYREAFFSRYLQRAAIILTGSNTGQSEIERFYQIPPERIKILPHPTPDFALHPREQTKSDILQKTGIKEGDYLLYPAQFWPHKNHINLLYALKTLRDKYGPTPSVIFVGSDRGNEKYIRQTAVNLGLSPQVTMLGFVSRSDLVNLYQNALALTYMSLFGPDNLPPLEAFALGCPVIASNISGAREQLEDAALFVDPYDPENIADAIFSVYHDPQLRTTLIDRGVQLAHRWTNEDFTMGVFRILDEFELVRRCWA